MLLGIFMVYVCEIEGFSHFLYENLLHGSSERVECFPVHRGQDTETFRNFLIPVPAEKGKHSGTRLLS